MSHTRAKLPQGSIQGSRYEPQDDLRKADLHLHSNFSYDVVNLPELSPRALYEKAVRMGMGFFTLTDHETMRGIESLRKDLDREYGSAPPIPLIPGIEIKVRDPRLEHTIHVNVLGLDQDQMLALARSRKSIDRFLDFCRREDLYHAYNHPFWFEPGERGTIETIRSLIAEFPLVELNAGRIPPLNGRTLKLARRFGREVVATSDSHTGRIGRGFVLAPGETPAAFLRNVREGRAVAVPQHITYPEFVREIAETIDLVFLKQGAFEIKPTFLRQKPLTRNFVRTALRSRMLMRPSPAKSGVRWLMQIAALAPAYAFILQQRCMHWGLGEV